MSDSNGTARHDGPVFAPPPLDVSQLYPQQRSALLEAMHAQVNALTMQVNTLTTAHREMDARADKIAYDVDVCRLEMRGFARLPFMARLRWFVTGR